MYSHLTLFLILLEVMYVLSGENAQSQSTSNQSNITTSTANPSTSNQSSAVLPLIIIRIGHSPMNPIQFEKCAFAKGTGILSGATKFATSVSLSLQGTQFYMCPVENFVDKSEKQDTSTEFAKYGDEYCVYPIKFEPNDPLQCPQEPEPFVSSLYSMKQGPDSLSVPCGEKKQGKMHWFVYKTCMTNKPIENEKILHSISPNSKENPIKYRTHFEVYAFCYDEENKEILYTKHKIMSPKLLNEKTLENERKKEYHMITDGYQIFKDHFETIKQQYSQVENSSLYKIQKLVPSDDFAFALWRKTTYHYLNVNLMKKDHTELWNYISECIRKKSIELEKQYIIFTGAFRISQNENKVAIEGQLKIPDTWIKIIYDLDDQFGKNRSGINNKALAIVIVDNMDDENVRNFNQNSCDINLCENVFENEHPTVSKFVKCCPVTNDIDKYFQLEKLSINGILDAAFLFESADQKHKLRKDVSESRLVEIQG